MQERILQGAFQLFSQYGIKSVSMDDIARHLSVSKKTIYQSYKDKNDIVLQIMRGMLNANKQEVDRCRSNAKDAVQEGIEIINHIQRLIASFNPSFFYDMQKYHPDAWQMFRSFREEFAYLKLKDTLQRGIQEGLYRDNINIEIMARMRIEDMEAVFNPFLFTPSKFNLTELIYETTLHFLYGVATIKGHKLINRYINLNEDA